ncbi:MAG TPA: glycosyltransferase family 2 protein [Bryobacteraceae bacterium]|jgi:glycosyltransferase involved in cell wall biosynthesis
MNLAVVVLTWNEEDNLPRCLESLSSLQCPVFIVDSGSTDETLDIARRYRARCFQHAFHTHNEQWSWALGNLPLESEWVLGLDADQSLTPELAEELKETFESSIAPDVDGFYVTRRQVFHGRWIRHGGYYPKRLLKIFRREKVIFDRTDLVDHHFYVPGRTLILRHDIVEDNRKEDDLAFWIEKHMRYAALIASEEHQRGNEHNAPIQPALLGSPDQRGLALRAWWRRLPLFVRPTLYFLYRYFGQSGWMDGKEGFLFHFLHAYWFRVMVDAKLDEITAPRANSVSKKAAVNN